MNKYKAVFTVPAEVHIEVEVSAENQQEGIVLAHDAIKLASASQARVTRLNLDSALTVSFDRVEAQGATAPVTPPSPLSMGTRFTIKLFAQDKCAGEVKLKAELATFEAAKALAESVLDDACHFGSASVHDQLESKVLEVQAPRGGWETEVVMANSPKPERYTWLESFELARKAALQLAQRKEAVLVRIYDYTDRKRGPVLKKEIR